MFKSSYISTLFAGVSICSLVSLAPTQAVAQAVDYGSLEQMFGEPITTSVTGSPERVSEAPAAMTIVSQDDIRHSGADNIPDVLQFVTGIEVRRSSFNQSDVAIRGYDQALYPRILVLVNGRQVYLDDYGYVDWNSIPVQLSEIRQIEVVKGPASALFGFNAAAGVINIITYDPLLDNVDTATARGGTQSYGQGEAVGTVHLGKTFGARISTGGFTANDFTKPVGPDISSPRNGRVNVDLRWQVTPKIQLRANASLTSNRLTGYVSSGQFFPTQIRTNDLEVGGAAETAIGLIDLDAYRNESSRLYGTVGVINVVRVVKLTDLIKLGSSNSIRSGFEYRNNLGTGSAYAGTFSYDDYAATAMWMTNLSRKLTLINAGRIDYAVMHSDAQILPVGGLTQASFNNTTILAPSFNSGLVYAATGKDTIRLTAARGLEMPSLSNLAGQVDLPQILAVGNPSLRPTATWNLDLGYDRDLSRLLSHFTVDGFLQRNVELTPVLLQAPLIFTPRLATMSANIGSSNEAGIEVGIKGKSSNGLRWNASYRFETISQDITSAVSAAETTSFSGSTPTSAIVLGAGYTTGPWEFDLNGRWQSQFRDYQVTPAGTSVAYEVGDYVTFIARIGYDLTKHITVAGVAQQFNLAQIHEGAGLPVDRRFIASVTVRY